MPVKSGGATYTGNMRGVFLRCGFQDVTGSVDLASELQGLQRGDVLLNIANHTAMYCGDGMEVEASINENGGTTGGQPGDQTGRDFSTAIQNTEWDCVLRYTGAESGEPGYTKPTYGSTVRLGLLKEGMADMQVQVLYKNC
ncbi:MAG: hypothetical protein V8T45_04140 [Oscillospiraceae bacterium]